MHCNSLLRHKKRLSSKHPVKVGKCLPGFFYALARFQGIRYEEHCILASDDRTGDTNLCAGVCLLLYWRFSG